MFWQTIIDNRWFKWSNPVELTPLFSVWIILLVAVTIWLAWLRQSAPLKPTQSQPETAAEKRTRFFAGLWLLPPLLAGGWLATQIAQQISPPQPQWTLPALTNTSLLQVSVNQLPMTPLQDSTGKLPEWLTTSTPQPDTLILTSSLATSIAEADAEIQQQAGEIIQQQFHKSHVWAGPWTVASTVLKERLIQKQHVERQTRQFGFHEESLYRLHVQLSLQPSELEQLVPSWRQQVSERRLELLVLPVIWCWISLGIWAAYYWLKPQWSTRYLWTIKLAGMSFSVILAGILETGTLSRLLP